MLLVDMPQLIFPAGFDMGLPFLAEPVVGLAYLYSLV